MNTPNLLHDDLRTKVSPLQLSMQNTANEIADPIYLFIDPKREQAAALGRFVLRMAAVAGESFSATPESSLSIYFPRDLLPLVDVRAVQLEGTSAEDWTMDLPTEDDAPLILKPRRPLTISRDQPQSIAFSQMLATSGDPVKLRSVSFGWEKFTGLADDFRICNATRELPPGVSDEKANLDGKWGPRTEYYDAADLVYVTPYAITPTTPGIANRLILRLGNKEDGQLQNNHAEFTVSFPTTKNGDARSALCTPEQLSKVQCVQVAPFQKSWQIEAITDSEIRHWILRPPAGAATVFGDDTYVSFEFSGLVTEMLVAPCAAVVSWSGIKGRKSGALRVAVEKTMPRPSVIAFNARAEKRELRDGDAIDFKEPVTLYWRLFASDACRVDEGEESALQTQLTLKPGDTKVVYPTKAGAVFTLTPQITLDGAIRRGIPVDKHFHINPAKASLRADPDRLVPSASDTAATCPTKTMLRWECASGDCFLSGPGLTRSEVSPIGQIEVTAGHDEYKIESIGLTTATATARVTLPLPFITFKVEPAANSEFRLTWQTAYIKGFRIGGPSPALPESRSPSGAMNFQFNATSMEATGAGTVRIRVAYAGPGPGAFPNITAIVYFGAQGPVFRWAVTDATEVRVMCIGKPEYRMLSGEIPMARSIELSAVNTLSPRRKNFANLTFAL